MYDSNKADRKYIDNRLRDINSLQASLGTDSTPKHRSIVKREQNALKREIKERDRNFWDTTFALDD